MIKPRHIEKGGTFGIISPSSPSETRSEIVRAKEYIESLGYRVVIGKNVNKTKGFVAGSAEDRAEDFNEMFRRDDIDAVFVTQGGYGTAQLLGLLDFEAVRANPKPFIGYSDITSLHLMINRFAGVVTFHGPGMARFNTEDLTEYTGRQFFKAVGEKGPIGRIGLADEKKWLNPWGSGQVTAPVIGGNLTLVCASLGTPYEIDCKGKILFIEELDTEPWIFDHMLCHLKNAGKLADAAGVLVGECQDCVPFKYNPGYYCDTSLENVLDCYLEPLGIPALYGLPLGHGKELATLPMGVEARLDCVNKTFEVLEEATI